MLIEINPYNIDKRLLKQVVDVLRNGGIIIYPTDSVYAMGCDLKNRRALEKLAKLKGIKLCQANFSIICYDLSNISEYTKNFDRSIFKLLKHNLPGPFTFILNATNEIPKLFDSNKKTIGIRVPDHDLIREIVKELGNPIVTTSIHDEDEILEYTTDPYQIYEKYDGKVDLIIDGGFGNLYASTVVDCTEDEPIIIREGIGELQ
ncbi:MAG: threonylcarbamoyl-AMP synthase [Crocinitomicaceae bacterium]|nr:threonylcarbamoyl-AMP synthase [Crocinitomicaceae bacterium]